MNDFTYQYFINQTLEFRRLFGDKSFWSGKPSRRDAAFKGYAYVYFNVKAEGEELKRMEDFYGATLMEYNMREGLMMRYGGINLIEG